MPRFTAHGEVCYEQKSSLGVHHSFWGPASHWLDEVSMGCQSCGGGGQAQAAIPMPEIKTLEQWAEYVTKSGSDFHEHVPLLTELATGLDTVVELGLWQKPSLPALLAGKPKLLVSINPTGKGQQWEMAKALKAEGTELRIVTGQGSLSAEPVTNDLFFHDTNHDAEVIYNDLKRWGPLCRRFIVVHCTSTFGEKGDLGGDGVLVGLRRWLKDHPEWSVVKHYSNNHGLTVLSCKSTDKPALPSGMKQVWNYGIALAKHIATGSKVLPQVDVDKRLDVCLTCDQRTENRCSACGCYLDVGPKGEEGKAVWADQDCPLGKWPRFTVE